MDGGGGSGGDNSDEKKLVGNMKIKLKIPKKLVPVARVPVREDEDELEEGEIREEEETYHHHQINDPSSSSAPNLVIRSEISSTNHHYVNDPSSSSANLVIKSEISGTNQDQERRFCPVCKKGFGNGKALGGHMRVHTADSEKPVKNPKLKIVSNPSPSRSPNLNPNLTFNCEQCDKKFRSEKSLFGHMRSHPERNWRGMHPPREPGADTGTCRGVIRWEKRGRRGWKGKEIDTSSSTSTVSLSSGSSRVAAASSLVHISGGRDDKGKRVINGLEYDSDEIYYLKNMGLLDCSDSDDDEEDQKVKKKIRVLSSIENDYNINNKINININNEEKRWKCSTCDKTFPSHQALGGHRSSHNKDNNKVVGDAIHTHTHIHTHIHLHITESTPVPKTEESTSDGQSTLERGKRDNSIELDLNEAAPSEDEAGFEV